MKYVHMLLLHISNILAICFIAYYILDRYNPMMKFIDNDVSKLLLLAFGAATLTANQFTIWRLRPDRRAASDKAAMRASKRASAAQPSESAFDGEIEEL